jgi:hypothetical protein
MTPGCIRSPFPQSLLLMIPGFRWFMKSGQMELRFIEFRKTMTPNLLKLNPGGWKASGVLFYRPHFLIAIPCFTLSPKIFKIFSCPNLKFVDTALLFFRVVQRIWVNAHVSGYLRDFGITIGNQFYRFNLKLASVWLSSRYHDCPPSAVVSAFRTVRTTGGDSIWLAQRLCKESRRAEQCPPAALF